MAVTYEATVAIVGLYKTWPETEAPVGGDFETEEGARQWLEAITATYGKRVVGRSLLKTERTLIMAEGTLAGPAHTAVTSQELPPSPRTAIVEGEIRRDPDPRSKSDPESQSRSPVSNE